MANSSLTTIRSTIRELIYAPSEDQLSNESIDFWINTFIQSDFSQLLKLFDLTTNFEWYCQAFVGDYSTNTTNTTSPLYKFKQRYAGFAATPAFIAGFPVYFTQSQSEFYNLYPKFNSIQQLTVGVGDGTQTNFTGTITGAPLQAGNVIFSSSADTLLPLVLSDVRADPPANIRLGNLYIPDDLTAFYGQVDYITGAYDVTFPQAPGAQIPINTQTIPYVPSRPICMLFYDNIFTLRPIPDQPYRITLQVIRRPTELLDELQDPEIEEWWQFICYGAAIKLLNLRGDQEGVQRLAPEFENQKRLVQRKTIFQNSNQRSSTIYVGQLENVPGWNGFGPYNGWY